MYCQFINSSVWIKHLSIWQAVWEIAGPSHLSLVLVSLQWIGLCSWGGLMEEQTFWLYFYYLQSVSLKSCCTELANSHVFASLITETRQFFDLLLNTLLYFSWPLLLRAGLRLICILWSIAANTILAKNDSFLDEIKVCHLPGKALKVAP